MFKLYLFWCNTKCRWYLHLILKRTPYTMIIVWLVFLIKWKLLISKTNFVNPNKFCIFFLVDFLHTFLPMIKYVHKNWWRKQLIECFMQYNKVYVLDFSIQESTDFNWMDGYSGWFISMKKLNNAFNSGIWDVL